MTRVEGPVRVGNTSGVTAQTDRPYVQTGWGTGRDPVHVGVEGVVSRVLLLLVRSYDLKTNPVTIYKESTTV